MWFVRKPSTDVVRSFLDEQSQSGFGYDEVGASRGEVPRGYDVDHNRIRLGTGPAVFHAACDAIRGWQMFATPWTEIHPARVPIEPGRVVAVLAYSFGMWGLNACRIVYVLDEATPARRFGFAYGTLPAHVERGEERFSIEWGDDDAVWYDLLAFSRPRQWMVRLGYPLARRMQRRFVRDSQAAMVRAIAGNRSLSPS